MNPDRRALLCFPIVLALLSPAILSAEIISVSTSGQFGSALNSVSEGDIIELAGGTYTSPSPNGWVKSNASASFTIRARPGQTVTLSGGSNRPIFKLLSAYPGVSVVFENLTFANGSSTVDDTAGGVTPSEATATFIDCRFDNNASRAPATGGGGIGVFTDSTAQRIPGARHRRRRDRRLH